MNCGASGLEGDAEAEGGEMEIADMVSGFALQGDEGVGGDDVRGETPAVGQGYAKAERAVEICLVRLVEEVAEGHPGAEVEEAETRPRREGGAEHGVEGV